MKAKIAGRDIVAGIAIPAGGFVLLTLTFLFNFLVFSLIDRVLPREFEGNLPGVAYYRHLLFLVIILVTSWLIFRAKKIDDVIKAVFATVPMGVVLATAGLMLYQWPVLQYGVCALLVAAAVGYLIKLRKQWFYYYAVALVSLALLVMAIFRVDI